MKFKDIIKDLVMESGWKDVENMTDPKRVTLSDGTVCEYRCQVALPEITLVLNYTLSGNVFRKEHITEFLGIFFKGMDDLGLRDSEDWEDATVKLTSVRVHYHGIKLNAVDMSFLTNHVNLLNQPFLLSNGRNNFDNLTDVLFELDPEMVVVKDRIKKKGDILYKVYQKGNIKSPLGVYEYELGDYDIDVYDGRPSMVNGVVRFDLMGAFTVYRGPKSYPFTHHLIEKLKPIINKGGFEFRVWERSEKKPIVYKKVEES